MAGTRQIARGAMPSYPVRQSDLAAALKLSPSTVSRALNNDPRLPAPTKERVNRLASSMGYRPDPLLSALASYRRRGQHNRQNASIAYLRSAAVPREAYHADLLAGAREFAARRDYALDYIQYDKPGDATLERILVARGIRGLLIEPVRPEDAQLRITFGRYAIVVVDKPYFSGDFDRVSYDNFGGGKEVFEQCLRRGCRRPGLVLSEEADRAGEGKMRAGYLIRMVAHGIRPAVPPLILPGWDERRFRRWLKREAIDVVITSQAFLESARATLRSLGLRVPGDVGLLNNNLHELPANASGLHHDNKGIGAFAAELLINKLARHEYGASLHPHLILQKGRWVEGGTLRPLEPGTLASVSYGDRLDS